MDSPRACPKGTLCLPTTAERCRAAKPGMASSTRSPRGLRTLTSLKPVYPASPELQHQDPCRHPHTLGSQSFPRTRGVTHLSG